MARKIAYTYGCLSIIYLQFLIFNRVGKGEMSVMNTRLHSLIIWGSPSCVDQFREIKENSVLSALVFRMCNYLNG